MARERDEGPGRTLEGVDDVRTWLAEHVYPPRPEDPPPDRIGLELEMFPFWTGRDGHPAARFALVEMVAVLDEVAERDPASGDGRPSWHRDDVLITEEPGAQLELAGPPDPDVGTALGRLERLTGVLVAAFAGAGGVLAAAGLDVWSDPDEVPVQLDIPRYEAMSTYFDRRGGRHGHLLMCASSSIQVNLDLGRGEQPRKRWLLANLAAPVLTAVFAASPTEEAVNGRAMGWRGLDPTRTGVPPPLVAGDEDPLDHVLADVLRADVMMIARDGRWHAGEPGRSFDDWLAHGHPDLGPPTDEDLRIHLTTLFPEARLRGFLEIRTLDALPGPLRSAATALVVGLFYDDRSVDEAIETLAPHRGDLPGLLERAAVTGLADDLVGSLAERVAGIALAGAERNRVAGFGEAGAYVDRFVLRRRHPSDELREALAEGPATALRWSTEGAAS